ncbi:hypothetical protein [Treponema sp.]|uniref:hypothetical protein n=1 Tax=Treponema sp. TaxID=166 RepID=UPI003F073256
MKKFMVLHAYKTSKKQENWNSLSQDYFEGKSLDEFNNNMKKSSRPIERSKIGLSERQSERLLYFVIVYSLVIIKSANPEEHKALWKMARFSSEKEINQKI